MTTHLIEIADTEYRDLERSASHAGLSVESFLKRLIAGQRSLDDETSQEETAGSRPGIRAESRWARFSARVRSDPPLSGLSGYIHQCSRELREDFSLAREDEQEE